MKKQQYLHLIFPVLVLAASSVFAQNSQNTIQFKGEIIDGPLKGQTITGNCLRNPRGDFYKQKSRCVMKMSSGFELVDKYASLEVVSGYRAIRIVLGPGMDARHEKGNFKLSTFQATTVYDRSITLFDFPRDFVAVDISIGGVSVAGGTATTNPDCLIWDIAGDGVF